MIRWALFACLCAITFMFVAVGIAALIVAKAEHRTMTYTERARSTSNEWWAGRGSVPPEWDAD